MFGTGKKLSVMYGTGRWAVKEFRDALGDPQRVLGRVGGTFGRFGTDRGTFPEVRDALGRPERVRGTFQKFRMGRGTLAEVWNEPGNL